MEAQVIGYKRVSYEKGGEHKEGIRIYAHVPPLAADQVGQACDIYYISAQKPCFAGLADIAVGDLITVYYNRFGNVDSVVINNQEGG